MLLSFGHDMVTFGIFRHKEFLVSKMILLHTPTPTGPERQVAVNVDEILRMEEVEGGTTQIIQMDKGPTTVKENLDDILEALGEDVAEVKPKPEPKEAPAKGGVPHAGVKAGAK
jgi:hypothetical protein